MRMPATARCRSSLSTPRVLRVLALAAAVIALGCGGEPAPPEAIEGCPSGSVPWTDGSCMPVGIQGCAEIFLKDDNLCHPRMEKCPAGTIP